jgi:hypothetical protein
MMNVGARQPNQSLGFSPVELPRAKHISLKLYPPFSL